MTNKKAQVAPPAAEKKPEVKTVTVKAKLSGPKPLFCCYKTGGARSPPCSLKLPPEILDSAGIRPNDEVELTAVPGTITIKKIGDGQASISMYVGNPATEPPAKSVLGQLMKLGKEIDAEQKRRRASTDEDEELVE
jgi:bifunctional DNA-binding transcriptional regulator/antitoxin component of YhaV-PrlF toxin-antitoxin module